MKIKSNVTESLIIPAMTSLLFWVLFNKKNPGILSGDHANIYTIIACVVVLAIFPLHEAIHAITWKLQGVETVKYHFEEMPKRAFVTFDGDMAVSTYVVGTLMPYVVLSFVPAIIAIATGNIYILMFSCIHSFGCCSDLLISLKCLPFIHKDCHDTEGETGIIII